MLRKLAARMLMISMLCAVPAHAAEIYQWTDEDGVTHFANSLADVPEKYRDQIKVIGSAGDPEPTGSREAAPRGEPAHKAKAPADEPSAVDQSVRLKRFEIPYQAYEGSARRVILPVRFNDRVTAPMALDTGSPGMVISIELAARLGIFSRDSGTLLTEAAGIGGTQAAILTIVDSVSVGDARSVFVPTTVTAGVSEAFEGLIGMDFLTNYAITIDSQRQVLVFQETPPERDARGGHGEAWWRDTFRRFRTARDYWRERAEALDRRAAARTIQFVEFQAREAERLLQRLHLHASDNAVPRHWR